MANQQSKVYPVLLAGGTGTRLWPVSRELYPKQLVNFIGNDSLVQQTIKRLMPVMDTEYIRVVCGKEHHHEIARHMEEIGVSSTGKIICEPCGRNTAPAILLAVLDIHQKENDAVLCILPADHMIKDVEHFHEKLAAAVRLAESGYIVTFGIRPHYPETGYGYIEGETVISENAFFIKRFIEKPDIETARQYIKAGNFFWNSGMFAFKLSVILEEFKKIFPDLLRKMEALFLNREGLTRDKYENLPEISIDYAIMEKTDKGVVLPSDFGWSDIGSWKSLYDFLPKDSNSNVIDGDVITKDTKNCIIMGYERLIATNRLTNMVVVETPDSVFVSDLDDSRDVKSIVAKLKETGRKEYHKHRKEYHPWGIRILLEKNEGFSVERIIIYPGSTYAIEADGTTLKHLISTKGQVDVSTIKGSMRLSRGKSVLIAENDACAFRNPCHEAVHMIRIDTVV